MSDKYIELAVELADGVRQNIHIGRDTAAMPLSELLRRNGLPLNTRCGQKSICNGCQVELVAGRVDQISGSGHVAAGDAPTVIRACDHCIARDPAGAREGEAVAVRVPERSRVSFKPHVVDSFRIGVSAGHAPLWLAGRDAPPAPASGPALGAAVDVGTTTVALLLVDLATGEVVARASAFNRQMHLGDDVLTRINLCLTDPHLVGRLQEALVNETLSELLKQALDEAAASPQQLVTITAAGNATMLHLLAGENPSGMGAIPFKPVFTEYRTLAMSDVDFRWPGEFGLAYAPADPQPTVHLVPGAGAYVGADLTAGIVASGMHYDPGPSLLVDVGTNGEIILKNGDKLLGCATAAGPAFEGSGLSNGQRAGDGAIAHVRIATEPVRFECEVLGGGKPIGICGSAYVDLLAEGRRSGIITDRGKFDFDAHPDLEALLDQADCHRRCMQIAKGRGGESICISEFDISKLVQARGAIAAGILTLLQRDGLKQSDIKTLYLAGGFGMHVDLDNALACGLLPGFEREQIELVGNTSLAGAYLAMLDKTALDEMSRIGKAIELIELNLEPGFEDHYLDQLLLA